MKKTLFLLLAMSGIAATRAATLDAFTQIDLSNLGSNNTYTVAAADASSAWSISLTIDAGTLRDYVELGTPLYHPTFAETPYFKPGSLISGDAASGLQIVDVTLSNNNRIGLDTNYSSSWPSKDDPSNSGSPVYNQYSHQGSISASGIYGSWNGGGLTGKNPTAIGNFAIGSLDFTTLDWDKVGTVAVTMTYEYGTTNAGIGTGLAISVYDHRGNLLGTSYGTNTGLRTDSLISSIQFSDAVSSAYLYSDRITAEDAATINEQIGLAQIGASKWSLSVNDISDIVITGDNSRRDIEWAVTATYELTASQTWDNSQNQLWDDADYLIGTNGQISITAADGVAADLNVSGADCFLFNREDAITRITGLQDVHFSGMGMNRVNPTSAASHDVEHAAIVLATGSSLSISDNSGKVSFTDYDITTETTGQAVNGGVFWLGSNTATLEISRNSGGVVFQNLAITRESGTGAIYGGVIYDSSSSTSTTPNNDIRLNANGCNDGGVSVLFDNVAVSSTGNISGGVVYMKMGHLQVAGNQGDVVFSSNSISTTGSKTLNGGAIYLGTGATAHLDNNQGNVIFSGNAATGETGSTLGAAVYGTGGAATAFSASGNSGQVVFSNNAASGKKANGAAIWMDKGSITMDGNGSVLISGNHADNLTTSNAQMYGGAIYTTGLLSISGNTGNVTIQDNYLSTKATGAVAGNSVMGGAIYSTLKAMTISHNAGGVSITGNHVDATGVAASAHVGGGAIYGTNAPLVMEGNGDVEFSGNYVRLQNSLSFNAVTLKPSKATTDAAPIMKLAAGEGNSIVFRDSVNINASTSQVVSLNAGYTDAEGKTCQATGNIVFTGKDAAGNDAARRIESLKASLGLADTTATDAEVSASLTSKLNAAVTLHNGTLSIEDGARLETKSFAIEEGAALQLKNGGTLSTAQSDELLFGEGTQILVQGVNNTIEAANLSFADGVTITFDLGAELEIATFSLRATPGALLTLDAKNLSLGNNIIINLVNADMANGGEYQLLNFGSDYTEEEMNNIAEKLTFTVDGVEADFSFADGKVFATVAAPVVPEPTTATLSLLALCGLAMRRRRASR